MKRVIKINIEVDKMDKEVLNDLIAFANKLNKTKEERPFKQQHLFDFIINSNQKTKE